jgi:hypothetical protein
MNNMKKPPVVAAAILLIIQAYPKLSAVSMKKDLLHKTHSGPNTPIFTRPSH